MSLGVQGSVFSVGMDLELNVSMFFSKQVCAAEEVQREARFGWPQQLELLSKYYVRRLV